MKRYIRSSETEEYYFVTETWTYTNLATGKKVTSVGYLSNNGKTFLNRPYQFDTKKFSKAAALSQARRLNAKNTDDSVVYGIIKAGF